MWKSIPPYLLPSVAWFLYFVIHSLLASLTVKTWVDHRWPSFTKAYRVTYNLVAVLLLIPVLTLSREMDQRVLWYWTGGWKVVATSLKGLAILGFLWTFKNYVLLEFMGFRQLKERVKGVLNQEHFKVSPLHRFVRHPWYFLILVILWAGDLNASGLLLNISVTLYFIIGSRLEENKLVQYHGDLYQNYKKAVPALLPRPWRFLDSQGIRDLYSSRQGF